MIVTFRWVSLHKFSRRREAGPAELQAMFFLEDSGGAEAPTAEILLNTRSNELASSTYKRN